MICATEELDVALFDVEIGDESGLDLADECHGLYPFLPIVIISGHDDREDMERALAIGVYGFLPEPVGGSHCSWPSRTRSAAPLSSRPRRESACPLRRPWQTVLATSSVPSPICGLHARVRAAPRESRRVPRLRDR